MRILQDKLSKYKAADKIDDDSTADKLARAATKREQLIEENARTSSARGSDGGVVAHYAAKPVGTAAVPSCVVSATALSVPSIVHKVLTITMVGDIRHFDSNYRKALVSGVSSRLGMRGNHLRLEVMGGSVIAKLTFLSTPDRSKLEALEQDLRDGTYKPFAQTSTAATAAVLSSSQDGSDVCEAAQRALEDLVDELGTRDQMVLQMMERMDKNGDRLLSREELSQGFADMGLQVAMLCYGRCRLQHFDFALVV